MALTNRRIKRLAKKPRARLEGGLSAMELQDLFFVNKRYPQYYPAYKFSPDLMKIYKLLVNDPELWQEGLSYKVNESEKLHLIFGTDFRHIFKYEVVASFRLLSGIRNEQIPLPPGYTPSKARTVHKGDTILIRRDTRDENLKVDLQILSSGLLQDDSEDFRSFTLDTSDVATFRKYLKLVDSDGVQESYL